MTVSGDLKIFFMAALHRDGAVDYLTSHRSTPTTTKMTTTLIDGIVFLLSSRA
jgi:hypothetical protein